MRPSLPKPSAPTAAVVASARPAVDARAPDRQNASDGTRHYALARGRKKHWELGRASRRERHTVGTYVHALLYGTHGGCTSTLHDIIAAAVTPPGSPTALGAWAPSASPPAAGRRSSEGGDSCCLGLRPAPGRGPPDILQARSLFTMPAAPRYEFRVLARAAVSSRA